jgi:hypothetical protein
MSGMKTPFPSFGDHAYTVDAAVEHGRKQSLGASRWWLVRSKCLSTKASKESVAA